MVTCESVLLEVGSDVVLDEGQLVLVGCDVT